jgi:bifunctional non-homologous end joining protein LigD
MKNKRIQSILNSAVKAEMPQDILPMHFKLCQQPFDGEEWQFEIKWDGFRMISYNNNSSVELRSRNNKNFNKRFAGIKKELQHLKLNAVLDGEVVVLDENGCSDFDRLLAGEKECLVYYVFDILWYDGYDLTNVSLSERRELLQLILPQSDCVRFSGHIDAEGKALFKQIQNHKIEGIVAKRKDSIYIPGIRTSNWLKIKSAKETQGVVAGLLLDKEKAGSGFSSLIVGVKEKQNYKCIGLVKTGITRNVLQEILTTAKAREKSIFSTEPKVNRNSPFRKKIKQAEIIWLEPDIKCKVKYLELDKFGMMRHASFRGLAG